VPVSVYMHGMQSAWSTWSTYSGTRSTVGTRSTRSTLSERIRPEGTYHHSPPIYRWDDEFLHRHQALEGRHIMALHGLDHDFTWELGNTLGIRSSGFDLSNWKVRPTFTLSTWELIMFRNLNLSTRIFGGFAIVLVLLIIVAYVGYNALSVVVDKITKAEAMNRLITLMLKTRQEEKDFIIRGQSASIEAVTMDIKEIKHTAVHTKQQFSQLVNKSQMNLVIKEVDEYAEAFRLYVELEKKKEAVMFEIRQKAQNALDQTEEIREAMKEQLFAYWNESQKLVADSLEMAEEAERLVRLALQAEALRISLMGKYTTQTLRDWDATNDRIFALTREMKGQFTREQDTRLADEILHKYKEFLAAFSRYQLTQMDRDLKKLKRTAREAVDAMEAIRNNQLMALEQVQTAFKVELDDKLKIADYANLMNKWLLDARMNEKEVVISRDFGRMDLLEDRIRKILTLGEYLKARFKLETDLNRVESTLSAVTAYKQAFDRFVDLLKAQENAERLMIKAAVEAQHVSDEAREEQKTKLEHQIAAANNLMLFGTVTAMLLGLVLAFSITRAIVNPIKTVVVKTAHAITEGDFSQEIAIYQNDEIGMLANAFRTMKDKIARVLHETDRLIQAVQHRRYDIRGDADAFQGSWRELVVGVNNVVDAFKLQEQLILSDKLASVGLLAAGVAHEINNPLEIIYNYLRYIKRQFTNEELHKALDDIYEEISAIAGIVSNLHAFSDNKKLIEEDIPLHDLIQNMLTLIKHSAQHRQITIRFAPCNEEITIHANKNEIKQVMLNLLKNSFEAMPSGGEIFIHTSSIRQNGSLLVQIAFTDTGPGIQIENPTDIFLPFYSTKKGQEDNLGLGLSVSYGIITKYHGTISVENIGESGCQFLITLPQVTQYIANSGKAR